MCLQAVVRTYRALILHRASQVKHSALNFPAAYKLSQLLLYLRTDAFNIMSERDCNRVMGSK